MRFFCKVVFVPQKSIFRNGHTALSFSWLFSLHLRILPNLRKSIWHHHSTLSHIIYIYTYIVLSLTNPCFWCLLLRAKTGRFWFIRICLEREIPTTYWPSVRPFGQIEVVWRAGSAIQILDKPSACHTRGSSSPFTGPRNVAYTPTCCVKNGTRSQHPQPSTGKYSSNHFGVSEWSDLNEDPPRRETIFSAVLRVLSWASGSNATGLSIMETTKGVWTTSEWYLQVLQTTDHSNRALWHPRVKHFESFAIAIWPRRSTGVTHWPGWRPLLTLAWAFSVDRKMPCYAFWH